MLSALIRRSRVTLSPLLNQPLSSVPPDIPPVLDVPADPPQVLHNEVKGEFQLQYPGHDPAYLRYRQDTSGLDLYTTVVPSSLEGRGVAKVLANAAFDHVVSQQLGVKLSCWYLAGYLKRHPREDVRSLLVTG